jgi:peptidoglycan/LPS O-acetylase OafA/YrhL
LDGLRFFAFLLVFFHHAPLLDVPLFRSLNEYGWIGVDLFFALSAFLFVKILAKEFARTGSISIGKFYIRRGLRIWPLYFLFCFMKIFLGRQFGREYWFSWRTFGLFTFTDNIFTAVKGYNPIPFTGHLWTISYEEQFYLIIPVLLLFLFRGRRARAVLFLSSCALLLVLVRAVFICLRVPHPAIWVLPCTHFEAILLGIVVGLGGYEVLLGKVPAWVVLMAGLGLAWLITCLPPMEIISWRMTLPYALVGLSTSLVVYFVFRVGKEPGMRWLSSRPLVYLGKISYGLYVFHPLGIGYGTRMANHASTWAASPFRNLAVWLVSLGITIALASISYRLIEKPFLKWKKRFEIIPSRPA